VNAHHEHGAAAGSLPLLLPWLLPGLLLIAAAVYVAASWRRSWPVGRTTCWLLGTAVAALGLLGPGLVGPGLLSTGHDLRGHVAGHLLLGMVAPLLLVWGAPVTLALRTLPRRCARVLARLLRARPVAVVTHPAVAALLDTGGMWVLYRTDVYAAAATRPALMVLVHVHMLLAGYLFAFSMAGPDPAPHRPPLAVRAAVLIAAVAAHDVLAKLLFAAPPAGAEQGVEAAAQLMYYGAAPVHLALFVLLGREWAAGQQRARRRSGAAAVWHTVGPRLASPPHAESGAAPGMAGAAPQPACRWCGAAGNFGRGARNQERHAARRV
jgi:putative membrane protein